DGLEGGQVAGLRTRASARSAAAANSRRKDWTSLRIGVSAVTRCRAERRHRFGTPAAGTGRAQPGPARPGPAKEQWAGWTGGRWKRGRRALARGGNCCVGLSSARTNRQSGYQPARARVFEECCARTAAYGKRVRATL